MVNINFPGKIAIISAVIFLIVGYQATYSATEGVVGGIVKQTGADYGTGNTLNNRGFIVHAAVAGLLMYLALKYGMKIA